MPTSRQIEANRKNALKSTGPKTAEGKAASRANALKHGLTGAGVVNPPDEAAAIDERMRQWRPSYPATTAEAEWVYREMITQTLRIDRCHAIESALAVEQSLRASLCWDDDRRHAAELLGARLGRHPARIAQTLARTPQGCDWLIERWRCLDGVLESGREWTDAQRRLASDLLGIAPELRDPDDDFGSHRDRADARTLIAREIERLEGLKTGSLDELDAFERESTESGLGLHPSPTLVRLRRYETACLHRFQAARALLQSIPAETPREETPPPPRVPDVDPLPPAPPPILPRAKTQDSPVPTRQDHAKPGIRPVAPATPPRNRRQRRADAATQRPAPPR